MTRADFHRLWSFHFPDTVPISYLFRQDYADRWIRIHSLPGSKRYADHDDEWDTLLSRQNQAITDAFGEGTPVWMVTGQYRWADGSTARNDEGEDNTLPPAFTPLEDIDLHVIDPDQYDAGDLFRPTFAPTIWKRGGHDPLLKAIANDSTAVFFVSFDRPTIVAPYDGGIDFILEDTPTREIFRNRYSTWLSEREDGL